MSDSTKVNRYTAYQSPLLPEEPSGFFTQYSETLPSFAQDSSEVTLAREGCPPWDFTDVTLAFEESAFKLLDVTLAQEDDRLGV